MTRSAAATSATRAVGALERLPPPASLLLVAGAAGLLVGCLRSEVFAQLTVQGLAPGAASRRPPPPPPPLSPPPPGVDLSPGGLPGAATARGSALLPSGRLGCGGGFWARC